MEAKKIFESGKLHGVYRCGKREEMISKIPRIEKEGYYRNHYFGYHELRK